MKSSNFWSYTIKVWLCSFLIAPLLIYFSDFHDYLFSGNFLSDYIGIVQVSVVLYMPTILFFILLLRTFLKQQTSSTIRIKMQLFLSTLIIATINQVIFVWFISLLPYYLLVICISILVIPFRITKIEDEALLDDFLMEN